jgi:MSHA biogenesis protein MshN
MSLINQMLQDLEKRRASGAERGALPNQVRVLPREEARSMPWWLIGIAAALALIALLAWQFNKQAPATAHVPLAQDQQPPPATLASSAPASRLALDLENVPAPAARAPATAGAAVPRKSAPSPLATSAVIASSTAVTTNSARTETKAEAARHAPPPVEAPKVASLAPTTPPAAVVAPVKPTLTVPRPVEVMPESKVQTALANPQIDKRAQTLTPQQLAENEYREAANFLNQGRLAEAQEGFRHALENYPAHVGARQGLFGLLLDAKKNGEAEQTLREGLKLNL